MNANRVGGGFCSERQEVRFIFPDTQQTLGRIVVYGLDTHIYDNNKNLKYIIYN